MALSKKNKRSKGSFSTSRFGYLETWFVGDEDVMATFLHEMRIKQINIPNILKFSWMKEQKLDDARNLLKLQRMKPFLELRQCLP